jgi:Mn2+/Fe2+ NRAMP family transporter
MSEHQEQSKGLPMAAKWDPEKLEREKAELRELATKPFFTRAKTYIKRSGPGLMQSAMTLGAGSAAASVMAGASFGYKLLWVQPLAMFLGVMMFAALGNIVLTTGERPYQSFRKQLGFLLIFFWAFGTIFASVIWHFPQYGLAAGATRSLVAEFTDVSMNYDEVDAGGNVVMDAKTNTPKKSSRLTPQGYTASFAIGLLILVVNCTVVFNYGSGSRGIRIYEWFIRSVIALVVLMFAFVVIANFSVVQWGEVFKGFIGYYGLPDYKPETVTMVLGMLGAAVGINMTFLYPYSLLAKGWGKEHKAASRWDLGLTMFLPFTLVTSLIMLGMTVSGVYTGEDAVNVSMTPIQAASSLTAVLGDKLGRLVFCCGLIGMTCTAISAHMVVCGFTMCEMLGLEYTKARFRLFALTPSIGILGVVFALPLYFPIVASAICLTLLPIAYLIFLILNNRRSYIGDAVGKGPKRWAFNAVLIVALTMATIGAAIKVKQGVYDRVRDLFFSPKPAVTVILSPIEISGEYVRLPFGKTDSRVALSGILNRLGYISEEPESIK